MPGFPSSARSLGYARALSCLLWAAGLSLPLALEAEELSFDTAQDWNRWKLPLGAVQVTPEGRVQPLEVRRNVDAVTDAAFFGGGIRKAGSNAQDAALVMDGDPSTGWSPDPKDSVEDWFIEVNLGRGVSANKVTLVFAADAPPFELFDLLLSTGEPQTDNIAAPIPGTLVYRIKERYKENDLHEVTFVPAHPDDTPIQYLRLENFKHIPGAKLVEVLVEAIGDNVALNLLQRGGNMDVVANLANTAESVPLSNVLALVDGDLYQRWSYGRASRGQNDIHAHIIVDLGAVYWLDLVRIVGGVVVRSGWGGGITTNHYVSRRRWGFRYYEFMTSDGALSPDGTRIWTKHFAGIANSEESSRGLVDHHFDLLPARYVRIFWKYWDTGCFSVVTLGEDGSSSVVPGCHAGGDTDEIQIFGEGYPQAVSFRSPLIDLRDIKNLNSLEWQADTPPGTRVEIRSRTGNEVVEKFTFYDKDHKEVTQKKWDKLIPSFRGPIDTSLVVGSDWSPWSKIYGFSGEGFQSASPRRYMEMDVRLASDSPEKAASLDYLKLNYTPPLARSTVGEITPVEVAPGVAEDFSYFLRSSQTNGFDRLRLETSAPTLFTAAYLEGQPVAATVETTATGFQLTFPQAVRSDQLVELRFASSIFLQSTLFDLFLEDSRQGPGLRQRVDPGDATDQVESSTNVVRLPVTRDLFAGLDLSSRVITPNSDGVNEQTVAVVSLLNVLEPRPLHLHVYDLSSRLLRVVELESKAGRQRLAWDGRDDRDQLVAPGMYIMVIGIEGDAGDKVIRRLVSVAY
ncbi:MAG: hypothetical protein EXS58_02235 [Candidatus Latescibacteria bacterium]|nr:hypothetical protein [Candidatus Latescibacterota bacterium]